MLLLRLFFSVNITNCNNHLIYIMKLQGWSRFSAGGIFKQVLVLKYFVEASEYPSKIKILKTNLMLLYGVAI